MWQLSDDDAGRGDLCLMAENAPAVSARASWARSNRHQFACAGETPGGHVRKA
jgi:hypothetical protein